MNQQQPFFAQVSRVAPGDTGVQFTRPQLFSSPDAIFGDDGTVAHLRLPQMLYRIESYVFGAAFVWCALYLLATTSSPTSNVTYGITILGLACFAASSVTMKIGKLFSEMQTAISEKGLDFKTVSNKGEAALTKEQITKTSVVRLKAGLELNIDLLRYTGAIIVGPLVLFSIYNMLPMGEGDFLDGRGMPVFLFVLGTLLFVMSKLLVFDFQYSINMTEGIGNLILVAGGVTCILIPVIDILLSAKHSPINSNIWFVMLSATIGYGIVYMVVQGVRYMENSADKREVIVDTAKHVACVMLDILILGFLVYGSLMDAYGRPFIDTRFFLNAPEIVLSPPPPSPPPPFPPP